MHRKSRYQKLCEAYRLGVKKCDEYRLQCREFVTDLRHYLLENFNCPETRLILYPPSQGFSTKVPILSGDSTDIEFLENGDSVIGFAVNTNDRPDELQNMFFTFLIRFRLQRGRLLFGIIEEEEEYAADEDGMLQFCDYLFKVAEQNLVNRLDIFLQDEQNSFPIGFRVGDPGNPTP